MRIHCEWVHRKMKLHGHAPTTQQSRSPLNVESADESDIQPCPHTKSNDAGQTQQDHYTRGPWIASQRSTKYASRVNTIHKESKIDPKKSEREKKYAPRVNTTIHIKSKSNPKKEKSERDRKKCGYQPQWSRTIGRRALEFRSSFQSAPYAPPPYCMGSFPVDITSQEDRIEEERPKKTG